MLRIILVRHGQTEWNEGSPGGARFRGRIDVRLSDVGEAQAQTVADCLADVPIAAIYASPLQRAQRTALPIAQARGMAVNAFEGLLDIDHGEWSGCAHTQVAAEWPALYAQWLHAPHEVQMPGGENLDDVRRRVSMGLDEIIARHQDEIVVLVGHQAVNKVLLCVALGLENSVYWRIRQDTCCINRLDHDGEAFILLTLNEVAHLPVFPHDLSRLPR